MKAQNLEPRELENRVIQAKQDVALVGLLAECLEQLAFSQADMSHIQRHQDAWAGISRLCESTRESLDLISEAHGEALRQANGVTR